MSKFLHNADNNDRAMTKFFEVSFEKNHENFNRNPEFKDYFCLQTYHYTEDYIFKI